MAAVAGAFSYGDGSSRESLWDQIKDLDPIELFVTSNAGSVSITNKVHSWVIDPITATSSQAGIVELTDTSYAATAPTLLTNTTQIIEKGIAVGMTDQNTKHAGFADRFAREQLKKMKEWKQQLEFSAVAGSLTSGTGTAARTMKGLAGFASTLTTTQGSGVSLTSDMLNSYLGNAWTAGGDHDTILVGRTLKERISRFTVGNTRNIDAKAAELVGRVDIYDSDHGRVEIVKHRYVNYISGTVTNTLVSYIKDFVQIGFLDEPHYEDRARTGYYKAGAIVGEATIQVDNELAVQTVKLLK